MNATPNNSDQQLTRPLPSMRVYILGPMRGVPLYNFPAFDQAEERLKEAGYIPISPADIDRENGFDPKDLPIDWDWLNKLPPSLNLQDIITRDIAAVRSCQGYFCLPNWQNSTGARAERALAEWCGLKEIAL